MLVIGEGQYPESKRLIVLWPANGRAETPIRINLNGTVIAELPANTNAIAPEPIVELLVNSGFDVQVLGEFVDVVEPAPATEGDAATDGDWVADAALALVRQPIASLIAAIAAGVPVEVLNAALAAEQGEGPGKARKGAVDALVAAIAAAAPNADQQPPAQDS
ncbi:hypothetical protein [Novosphingobium sp. FKTRR1]|uniref:hypothetical protein n=1 Tax=Novosphingobium sp. FKTRR1 TaxID=2879118 RepID=UPI001CEFBBD2|nr:hypothetical protein [Novosphingobium sp. FKTRR1]